MTYSTATSHGASLASREERAGGREDHQRVAVRHPEGDGTRREHEQPLRRTGPSPPSTCGCISRAMTSIDPSSARVGHQHAGERHVAEHQDRGELDRDRGRPGRRPSPGSAGRRARGGSRRWRSRGSRGSRARQAAEQRGGGPRRPVEWEVGRLHQQHDREQREAAEDEREQDRREQRPDRPAWPVTSAVAARSAGIAPRIATTTQRNSRPMVPRRSPAARRAGRRSAAGDHHDPPAVPLRVVRRGRVQLPVLVERGGSAGA